MKSNNDLNPTIPPNRGREAGEARKREALDSHEACRVEILRRGRRAFLQTLIANGSATADDVAKAIEVPPQIDGRCLGSIPGPFAKSGVVEREGYVKSARPSRHASILTVWKLIDTLAARRWLAMNLPPPDDDNAAAVMITTSPKKPSPMAATIGLDAEAKQ